MDAPLTCKTTALDSQDFNLFHWFLWGETDYPQAPKEVVLTKYTK